MTGSTNLTDLEREILDVESRHWRYAGAKETHVREQLGISPVRYHQVLNALLEREEALAYAPAVVGRLRRLREARAAERGGSRPGERCS